MRIGIIGINHKLADLKLRECFARICHQNFKSGIIAHFNIALVPLTTCNRCEIYFCSDDLAHSHSYLINVLRKALPSDEESIDQRLYSYFGHDCFKHLCRVTAGLDSAIVAESEIQGQVKAAYEEALKHSCLPGEMHYLFQKSLKIGKHIRTQLPLGRGIPELEHAILNASHRIFLEPERAKILFVGASEINRRILAFFKKRSFNDITICNRSPGPANTMSNKFQIATLDWAKLSDWPVYDLIVLGTKSPEHIIEKDRLASRCIRQKLIIDLCVPRNVDPQLGKMSKITLLNIDEINRTLKLRKQKLHGLLSKAETIVHQATKKQITIFFEREKRRHKFLAAS